MRNLLHIGEVAQLLGVTPKTIRHYQKLGLLHEAERTTSGYRLFSAQDLLRVQRVRRLQALGLSLKQIKSILGDPAREHSLREVLQALDSELATEITLLQTRRERIQSLLNETSFTSVEHLPVESPGLALAQELLADHLSRISPEMMEIEKQIWNLFDNLYWPEGYRASIEQLIRDFASQPELLSTLVSFSEQLTSLASLPEDAPEVADLLKSVLANPEIIALLQSIYANSQALTPLARPFAEAFKELLGGTLSPAQLRFYQELFDRISFNQVSPTVPDCSFNHVRDQSKDTQK